MALNIKPKVNRKAFVYYRYRLRFNSITQSPAGFHTGQAYSRIGRTQKLKAAFIAAGSLDPKVFLLLS